MSGSWPPQDFPGLKDQDYTITSPKTLSYNCLAWAAKESTRWWEPVELAGYYWPEGASRDIALPAFVQVYVSIGYTECNGPDVEEGFEKLALYADSDHSPTHVARQLPNGRWTSKLGEYEDIEHLNLDCLNGALYGEPAIYLRRPIAAENPQR
jgi:hypothetical protein